MNNAKFKDSGLAYLLCFILVLGASIVLSTLVVAIAKTEGSDASEVLSRSWVSYLATALSELTFAVSFLIITLKNKDKNFKATYKLNFKFDTKIFLTVCFLGVFVMLCSLNLTNLVNVGFSYISVLSLSNNAGISLNNFGEYLLSVLFLAILPSVCEELVFRGVIFNGLRQKFSKVNSIIICAIMFALIHLSIYKTFYQIILGVILCILLIYTGSVFYGVIFHFVNNFTILTISYIFKSNNIFEFSNFGVSEILLSILIFLIGFLVTFLVLKFLISYTKKHKNYFNLDLTNEPLQSVNLNSEDLSYEQKLANNNKSNEGVAIFLISIFLALIMWSFNSFGGFL